ncbi:MAG: hypothetical protein U9R58_06270 [Chloroflexota bacterium]|nr:hypothetical protein [Chloroflexota bacterium]
MEFNASPPLSSALYRASVYLDCDDDWDTDKDDWDMMVIYDSSGDVVAVYTGDLSYGNPTDPGTTWGQPVGAYLEWGIPLSQLPPNNPDLPDQPDCEVNTQNPGAGTSIGFFVFDASQQPAREIDITEGRGYDIPNTIDLLEFRGESSNSDQSLQQYKIIGSLLIVTIGAIVIFRRKVVENN